MFALLFLAQATTNCTATITGWRCETEQSAPLDYGRLMQSGADLVPTYRPQPIDRAAMLRQQVGRLVAANRCADAEQLAVKNGDFGLAGEVKRYCDAR